jgi:hypothetical protein
MCYFKLFVSVSKQWGLRPINTTLPLHNETGISIYSAELYLSDTEELRPLVAEQQC